MNLQATVELLWAHDVTVLLSSSVYETEPVGEVLDQRAFYNACLRIETRLEARRRCSTPARRSSGRSGAVQAGEDGYVKHGPRAIDVDVLLLGGRASTRSERLTLPHREVTSRRFVLVPLLELDAGSGGPGPRARRTPRWPRCTARTCGASARRWRWVRRMLLVVDVGNTQTHLGAYEGDRARARLALRHRARVDRRRARRRAHQLCWRCAASASPTSTRRSSRPRCPSLRPQWTAMAQRYLGHEMLLVGPGLQTGMPIRYDNPREIGPDRLVNAVAGYERVGGACVIVDFGTAVTHDVVSAERRVPRRRHLPGRRDLARSAQRRGRRRCRRSTSRRRAP